jgi:curved DNA-binding protein CbpA
MEVSKSTENWYAILGLSTQGANATEREIEQAYRKRALKWHPDKNKDPAAPARFDKLTKAKNFLLDPTKRQEYDASLRHERKLAEHKQTRDATMDENRKRAKQKLEEQERLARSMHADRTSGSVRQSQEHVDELRKQGRKRRAAAEHTQAEKEEHEFWEHRKQTACADPEGLRQVKVKWRSSDQSHSDETLYDLFRDFGVVEEVHLVDGRGNKAIVTFATEIAARKAVQHFAGSDSLAVGLVGEPQHRKRSVLTHVYATQSASQPQAEAHKLDHAEETLRTYLHPATATTSTIALDAEAFHARQSSVLARLLARASGCAAPQGVAQTFC